MGLYTWAHIYTNICRSLNYRRSGVQYWTTRKPTPPSLNYHCSGVKDWTKESTKGKYPPTPQPQLATGYVEAGAKLRESRGGKTLGEDVGKLGGGRDMENPNIADSDPVVHEVQVDLHMLRPLVLNRVGGEVHGADVVAVDERALGKRAVKLSQELSEPGRLRHTIRDRPVLHLSTGAGDNRAASPVSVGIDHQLRVGRAVKNQAEANSATDVAEETLQCS